MVAQGPFFGHGLLLCLGVLVVVLLVLVVALVVYLITRRTNNAPAGQGAAALTPRAGKAEQDALEVARLRYARGEITRDEFLQIKADLQSPE